MQNNASVYFFIIIFQRIDKLITPHEGMLYAHNDFG